MDSKMIRTDGIFLLLDVGGTYIKEALFTSDGTAVPGTAVSVPISSAGTAEEIRASLNAALTHAAGYAEKNSLHIACVGVAIPGPFDYDSGIFLMKHKFSAVYGRKFTDIADCGILPGAGFRFIHDVNCMLLGELVSGKGRNYANVALVAIGTGLGFTVCRDRNILLSPMKSPGVSIYNRPYRDGILEDYVSKRGFLRIYGELTGCNEPELTVAEIGHRAAEGEDSAVRTFETAGSIIAESVAPILAEYGVECLLFGGQISKSYRFMDSAVKAGLSSVSCLKEVGQVSDIDNATFNGLCVLLDGSSQPRR